jgi:hypothetical protein
VPDRALDSDTAAQAVTDDVRARNLEVIQQPGNIVCEVFICKIAFDVGRSPVALHFDGDHFSRFGEFPSEISPLVRDRHERTV